MNLDGNYANVLFKLSFLKSILQMVLVKERQDGCISIKNLIKKQIKHICFWLKNTIKPNQ